MYYLTKFGFERKKGTNKHTQNIFLYLKQSGHYIHYLV
jgi:hypothetical protein